MPSFPKSYDFLAIENEISAFWDAKKVREAAIAFDQSKKLFSFLEGPPTANAPPGLHHVQSRFYKDIVCRFNYMKGFSVPRKGGWDCHGLPVEVQVEKKLGLKTKKDVLDYGVGKFNRLCREDVFAFIKEWDNLTLKMAFWVDVKNPYKTLDNSYIESVWWSLKELYHKNLLYEDYKVIPYCPRCETPLSSHEVALGYKDVAEMAITSKFQLKGTNRYLLAWTTTPWTTPSNLGLAVGKGITYAVIEENGSQYVVAKDAVPRYFENAAIIEEFSGSELLGKEYLPLFDYFVGKLELPAWRIIAADFVNTDEGTGIVHQAPAFGEDDFEAMKAAGMAFVQPVDESGRFTSEVPDFEGQFVKDADVSIIAALEKKGSIFRKEKYKHSYPYCWRCDTPLIYYALKSWFVRVTAYRERLIELNQQISWYPAHVKDGRFGDWLINVKDWALSRNKFWGTPLPIWECLGCGQKTAIGSVGELEAAAGREIPALDLHKPDVDEITFPCGSCSGKMTRVPYVIDCWYDSGAAFFAQLHYPFENKELFSKLFPYSFITESIDQTRGWFYTLHVLGTLLFGSVAYKSVVVGGLVVDEKGEKMSKSKGNILKPFDVFGQVGVDAVRLHFSSYSPDSPKRFSNELVRETAMPFLTTLWNVCVFSAEVFGVEHSSTSGLKIEDRWIISKANSLASKFTEELEAGDFHRCYEGLGRFVIDDLSRWYVRIVRERNDDAVADTLEYVIGVIARLLAPFAPYTAEYISRNLLSRTESIHTAEWPKPEKVDAQLEEQMELARSITQSILSIREKIRRGLRWPVKEAVIVSASKEISAVMVNLSQLVSAQANVRKLVLQPEFKEAKERLKPDYSKLGPVFGDATPSIIAQLAMRSQDAIVSKLNSEGKLVVNVDDNSYELTREFFISATQLPERYDFALFEGGAVYIDKDVTPEMEAEGLSRELLRLIQQSRKEAGLKKGEAVDIAVKIETSLAASLKECFAQIKEKANARSFIVSDKAPSDASYKVVSAGSIKGSMVEVFLRGP